MADDLSKNKASSQSDINSTEQTDSTPQAEPTPSIKTVRAIALRPIYTEPGQPPLPPNTALTVCVTTMRAWLRSGIAKLSEGESLPEDKSSYKEGAFPIFPKSSPSSSMIGR